MKNYYQILELPLFSEIEEVKKQFRKLAIQYHPDKNPLGDEKFREIAEAYEVLSDPEKKKKYDAHIRYQLYYQAGSVKNCSSAKSPFKEKNPLSKQEAERRRYYEQHYARQKKTSSHYDEEKSSQNLSNEFRNILIAIPLAVLLFLWIINWFDQREVPKGDAMEEIKKTELSNAKEIHQNSNNEAKRWYGKRLYTEFFKPYIPQASDTLSVEISNQSQYDMILLLLSQSNDVLIQSVYLPHAFSVKLENLPFFPLQIRIQSGNHYVAVMNDSAGKRHWGGFLENEKFYFKNVDIQNLQPKWIINKKELESMQILKPDMFISLQ